MGKAVKTSIWALRSGMIVIKCDKSGVPFNFYGRPLPDEPQHEVLNGFGVKDVFLWVEDPVRVHELCAEFTVGKGDDVAAINIVVACAMITELKKNIALAFDAVKRGVGVSVRKLASLAIDLATLNSELPGILANTLSPKEFDVDIEHATKVCLHTIQIAGAMNIKESDIADIAVAAIFHDVGFARVPSKVMEKTNDMTPVEISVMRNHTDYSIQMLNKCQDVAQIVETLVLQHHELCDGSGYPSNIPERYIHPLAKILTVADVYDTLLVGDFENAKVQIRSEAMKLVISGAGRQYGTDAVKAFAMSFGVLPVGSYVKLSSGVKGIVCELNRTDRMRPKILTISQGDRAKITLLNLAKDQSVKIDSSLDPALDGIDVVRIFNDFLVSRIRATVSH